MQTISTVDNSDGSGWTWHKKVEARKPGCLWIGKPKDCLNLRAHTEKWDTYTEKES